jgi:hypothetical protein
MKRMVWAVEEAAPKTKVAAEEFQHRWRCEFRQLRRVWQQCKRKAV